MGPEGEALLIKSDKPAHAVDDRAPLPQGGDGVGLDGTGASLEPITLHDLQPGQPARQAEQSRHEKDIHGQQPFAGQRLDRHHAMAAAPGGAWRGGTGRAAGAAPAGGMTSGGGGSHQ